LFPARPDEANIFAAICFSLARDREVDPVEDQHEKGRKADRRQITTEGNDVFGIIETLAFVGQNNSRASSSS
jgi:hypothetical protein